MLSFFHISWFLTTLDHLFACIRCPAKGNDIQMNLLWLSMLWPGMVRLSMLQLNMARLNIPRSISSLISKCCNFLLTLQDFTTFLSLRYCGFPWKRGNVVNFPEFLNFYNILLKQVAFMRQRRTIWCWVHSNAPGQPDGVSMAASLRHSRKFLSAEPI